MALGRVVAQTGRIPLRDIFSSTASGNEWISSGWFSSLLLYLFYSRWHVAGLDALVFAVISLAYLAVYFHAVVRVQNRGSMLVLLLIALIAANMRFTPRPEIFSQLCLALLLLAMLQIDLELQRNHSRLPPLACMVPVLMMLWANCHAGILIGLLVLAMFCVHLTWKWKQGKATGLVLAICSAGFVTWMINPYGWNILKLAGKIGAIRDVEGQIMEWMPLIAPNGPALPAAVVVAVIALVVLIIAAVSTNARRIELWHVAALTLFAVLPFWQRRHMGISAIALPVLAMPSLARADRLLARIPGALQILAFVAVFSISLLQYRGDFMVGRGLFDHVLDTEFLPTLAVKWMQDHRPPPNLYNSYGAGGYLLYHLYPETKVYIDGRLDVYSPEVWEDSNRVELGGMEIGEFADKYHVQSALIYIRGIGSSPQNIARRLSAAIDWKLVYFDDAYALFVRDTPETERYVRENAYHFVHPFDLARIMSVGAKSETNTVQRELQRALNESQQGAKALLIAAVEARERGDEAAATKFTEMARVKNPAVSIARPE